MCLSMALSSAIFEKYACLLVSLNLSFLSGKQKKSTFLFYKGIYPKDEHTEVFESHRYYGNQVIKSSL